MKRICENLTWGGKKGNIALLHSSAPYTPTRLFLNTFPTNMKLTDSLVSIIIPAYNASTLLPRAIESLLNQSYLDIEIIVIDDSSRDDTYKIATILKKCDSRIKILRNKKRYGPAICLNRAMRIAKGRFVTFMNPTDVASMHKIKKQVNFLKKNPKTVAVGTQCTLLKEASKTKNKTSYPEHHDEIYPTLLHGISMRFESTLIDRHLLPKDIIKFTTNTYPFIFSSLFMKLLQYGKLANLNHYLYAHYEAAVANYKKQGTTGKAGSYMKLFLQSFTEHDYRPSLKAFLEPFTSPVKTIFD